MLFLRTGYKDERREGTPAGIKDLGRVMSGCAPQGRDQQLGGRLGRSQRLTLRDGHGL